MAEEKKEFRCKLALEASGLGTMEQIKNRKESGLPHPWICRKHQCRCEGSIVDVKECPEWAGKRWPLYAVDCKTGEVTHIKTKETS